MSFLCTTTACVRSDDSASSPHRPRVRTSDGDTQASCTARGDTGTGEWKQDPPPPTNQKHPASARSLKRYNREKDCHRPPHGKGRGSKGHGIEGKENIRCLVCHQRWRNTWSSSRLSSLCSHGCVGRRRPPVCFCSNPRSLFFRLVCSTYPLHTRQRGFGALRADRYPTTPKSNGSREDSCTSVASLRRPCPLTCVAVAAVLEHDFLRDRFFGEASVGLMSCHGSGRGG